MSEDEVIWVPGTCTHCALERLTLVLCPGNRDEEGLCMACYGASLSEWDWRDREAKP